MAMNNTMLPPAMNANDHDEEWIETVIDAAYHKLVYEMKNDADILDDLVLSGVARESAIIALKAARVFIRDDSDHRTRSQGMEEQWDA